MNKNNFWTRILYNPNHQSNFWVEPLWIRKVYMISISQKTPGDCHPPKWWSKVRRRRAWNTRNKDSRIKEKRKETQSRNTRNASLKNRNYELTKIVPKFPAPIFITQVVQKNVSLEIFLNCLNTGCTVSFWQKQRQILSERQ